MAATRHPRRTDEEWLRLIQECRTSGLSDKNWCEEHHIHTSNFYYHIRRLRNLACDIPDPVSSVKTAGQEIVPVSFHAPAVFDIHGTGHPVQNAVFETAVRISLHGIQVDITNAAAGETVFQALSALQKLC